MRHHLRCRSGSACRTATCAGAYRRRGPHNARAARVQYHRALAASPRNPVRFCQATQEAGCLRCADSARRQPFWRGTSSIQCHPSTVRSDSAEKGSPEPASQQPQAYRCGMAEGRRRRKASGVPERHQPKPGRMRSAGRTPPSAAPCAGLRFRPRALATAPAASHRHYRLRPSPMRRGGQAGRECTDQTYRQSLRQAGKVSSRRDRSPDSCQSARI